MHSALRIQLLFSLKPCLSVSLDGQAGLNQVSVKQSSCFRRHFRHQGELFCHDRCDWLKMPLTRFRHATSFLVVHVFPKRACQADAESYTQIWDSPEVHTKKSAQIRSSSDREVVRPTPHIRRRRWIDQSEDGAGVGKRDTKGEQLGLALFPGLATFGSTLALQMRQRSSS